MSIFNRSREQERAEAVLRGSGSDSTGEAAAVITGEGGQGKAISGKGIPAEQLYRDKAASEQPDAGGIIPGQQLQEPIPRDSPEAAQPIAPAVSQTAQQEEVTEEEERAWQAAGAALAQLWPSAPEQPEKLLAKMNEIGSRLGDPLLWRRDPRTFMQAAATELYGMPGGGSGNAGLKYSLELPGRHPLAPVLTEEEQLKAEIAAAHRPGIF